MKREQVFVIAKHDGAREPFSDAKLRNCLTTVLAAARQDPKLANPLARAVAMHLHEWAEREPPSSEYVYRCVQAVFAQTGLERAGRCMAVHRRRRRARRKQVYVVYPDRPDVLPVNWQKSAVVAALRKRHGLDVPVARLLAGEVESRLLAMDFKFVQAGLVAAVSLNVLMAWGLAGEVQRFAPELRAVVDVPAAEPLERKPQEE